MAPRKEKSEKASADQGSSFGSLDTLLRSDLAVSAQAKVGSGRPSSSNYFLTKRLLIGPGITGSRPYSVCSSFPQLIYPPTYTTRSPRVRFTPTARHLGPIIGRILKRAIVSAHAAKTLKEMQERNEIVGRAAGKQSVYHVFQDPNEAASPEELATMDVEISTLKEETTTLKADEKALRSTLSTLKTTMSTHDLREAVHALELELKTIEARLSPLRSGNVVPVSAEERALVEKEWREVKRVVEVRRKGCMSLWADLSEQLPEGTTREELWERLGLENDP
ncbi:MAG: hypothetical protein M1835_003764 [Candelina submexicana]|nr:MAG: hypothetical protein M1835_003764 [Candelina submexicana]